MPITVGVPREIKNHEYRVGLTPQCVERYVQHGHRVLVERSAGLGAGFIDDEYVAAGALLVDAHERVFADADMIVKVKEPLPSEYPLLRAGQLLFTYLHLAAVPDLAAVLVDQRVTSVAYETIQRADGSLPCLTPMSAVAGRLATQQGAKYLEKPFGGRGVLLGGVPGVPRGRVLILGGGVVGANAAEMAVGLGADVTLMDVSTDRLIALSERFGGRVQTLLSNERNLRTCLPTTDLVIGAVLIPGASAPKLIRREHLALLPTGAVIVDVAVDQGGCVETTHPTTHDNPTFVVDGIVHYCVANMPAAVSRTSTLALTATTLRYGLLLADHGIDGAIGLEPALRHGLNTRDGSITHAAVARSLGKSVTPPRAA